MNTKKEKELPAAADVAAIAHLRAVDAAGASVNATPAQIRQMVGIDYSSLVEQEVRGEKWLGVDGKSHQVYTRTLVFTSPKDEETFMGVSGVEKIIAVVGGATLGGIYKTINNAAEIFVRYGDFGGSVRVLNLWHSQAQFVIALKYTKI